MRRPHSGWASSPGLSLQPYALALLSRRDYSREELARKLMTHLRRASTRRAAAMDQADAPDAASAASAAPAIDAADIDALLDALERDNWLSNTRFAQSFARRRGAGRGTAQVLHELRPHQLGETTMQAVRSQLLATELQRAQQAWEKKFGQPPADAKAWAKQARFMLSRGFSASTFKQVLAQAGSVPSSCTGALEVPTFEFDKDSGDD